VISTPLLFAALVTAPAPGISWGLSSPQLSASCANRVAEARARLVAARARTGLGGLLAVEQGSAELSDALVAHRLLQEVSPDPDVREASARCSDQVAAFAVDVAGDPAVYALAKAASDEAKTQADRQLARAYLEAGRRAGAELDPAKRARIARLLAELKTVESSFMRALAGERATIEISRAEAASLPDSFVATLTPATSGRLSVPVNDSTFETFMKDQASRDARRRFLLAHARRGGRANVRRLQRALALRRSVARLLGFQSWAALQLDTRMAKSPDRVLELLQDVDARLLGKARQEIGDLARREGHSIEAWDYDRALERLNRSKSGVSSEAVRRYFPLTRVVTAMIALCERLFGVIFRPVASADAWAAGVLQYEILDASSGATLAWAYLDLEAREGKLLRPASFPLRAGRTLPGGMRQVPMSAIIGNAPTAAPGAPPLLSHKDVVDLFHEFGHLLHGALSTAPYAMVDSANVRGDFVEAPSQMFESWMWQPAMLREISASVDTGEPLPEELANALIARRHAYGGALWTRQALLATYDLLLHGPAGNVDATRLWFELARKLTAVPPAQGTFPEASFIFLMDGYDAGYYGYLWSRVHAADLFTAFQQGGLENAAVGLRFRREVLEPGATVEPDELIRRFLGRPPRSDAFYAELGL
jgi:thimet oligopeptidase